MHCAVQIGVIKERAESTVIVGRSVARSARNNSRPGGPMRCIAPVLAGNGHTAGARARGNKEKDPQKTVMIDMIVVSQHHSHSRLVDDPSIPSMIRR